jgi:hypothetical protein
MAKTKTKINKLEKQVLLNETDALPVADINMTIDGRYITEKEFKEMVETFDPNNLKVGWYIGHIWNFWMEKDKEPEKQGIIRDIDYKDGVLYVYSQDLNPEFLEAIESGKYTDLSIESQRLPTEKKIENEDGEEEQEYKRHLTGIAAVKTGAFSRYGLVEYKQYSINNISYKVINQPNFFQVREKQSEVLENMSKKNTQTKIKDEDQTIIYEPENKEITSTEESEVISNDNIKLGAYVDDLQKEEIRAKEEIKFLEAQIAPLKRKIEDKNNEIDELKKVISAKEESELRKDFMIFYLRGIKEKKLHNKFMEFDDSVDILNIKLEDIYNSKMWRDYASNSSLRESIEKQLERKFFTEEISKTQYGNVPPENNKPTPSKNYSDDELFEYAKKLCKKEKGTFTSDDLSIYLKKAQREIARNNY